MTHRYRVVLRGRRLGRSIELRSRVTNEKNVIDVNQKTDFENAREDSRRRAAFSCEGTGSACAWPCEVLGGSGGGPWMLAEENEGGDGLRFRDGGMEASQVARLGEPQWE